MNETIGKARIGQWYMRADKGESFVVTGLDEHAGTIEIQTFDGEIDEIDGGAWNALPLTFAEPPEDWSGPFDLDPVDSSFGEDEMSESERLEPLQPLHAREEENWEDTRSEDERDPLGEGRAAEEPLEENPGAACRID